MKTIQRNQKCVMSAGSKHAGKIGYFQFFGTGASAGVAVFTTHPLSDTKVAAIYFAVGVNEFEMV